MGVDAKVAAEVADLLNQARSIARRRPAVRLAQRALVLRGLWHDDLSDDQHAHLLTVFGLTNRTQTDYRQAIGHFDEALDYAMRAGDEHLRIDITLYAAEVHCFLGESAAGLAMCDDLRGQCPDDFVVRLCIVLARASLMLDRPDEASEHIDHGVATATRLDDRRGQVIARVNRANINIILGNNAKAEVDLRYALASDACEETMRASAEHNLGVLLGRQGAIRESLARLDNAAELLSDHPLHLNQSLADRIEIMLNCRLFDDAERVGQRALDAATSHGIVHEVPEILLTLARTAIAKDEASKAAELLSAAADLFDRQQRVEQADIVRLADRILQDNPPDELPELEDRMPILLETLLFRARLAKDDGDTGLALRLLTHASSARSRSSHPHHVILGWQAEASAALLEADASRTRDALASCCEALGQLVADIDSIELRSAIVHHLGSVETLGIQLAALDDSPEDFLRWTETIKQLELAPATGGSNEADLTRALELLREEVSTARSGFADTNHAEIATLEERIRSVARRSARQVDHEHRAVDPRMLMKSARGSVVFANAGGTVHRLSDIDGVLHVREVGHINDISRQLQRLSFAVSQIARDNARDEEQIQVGLDVAAELVDASLFGDLLAAASTGTPVVIVPGPGLTQVPWRLLPSLRDRPIRVRHQLLPSNPRLPAARTDVTAIAGPRLDDHVVEEIDQVCAAYGRSHRILGGEATIDAVLEAMRTSSVVHLAAHGTVHPTDPLLSTLELADGPLTVYDLQGLGQVPATIVLASCRIGGVASHDVTYNLATVLAERGATEVIVSNVDLADQTSVTLMPELHRHLAAGRAASEALGELDCHGLKMATTARSLIAIES